MRRILAFTLAVACARAGDPLAAPARTVAAFAAAHGLPPPRFAGVTLRIFADQAAMWRAYRAAGGPGGEAPPRPRTVAAVHGRVIFVVEPAELARRLPDEARLAGAFDRVVAHELTHLWHEQITGGRLGPRWFAEGLASLVAGQGFGADRSVATAEEALAPIDWDAPEAYADAAAAVRFFAARVPPAELVRRAAEPGFDEWLRALPAP